MNDIYVAIWESKGGDEIRAFSSLESAWKWREEIAQAYWDTVFDGNEAFDVDLFWDNVYEEWFNIEAVELEP